MFKNEDATVENEHLERLQQITTRQEKILNQVRNERFVTIEALADAFGLTPQTIRRDVNELCQLGVLHRYHGGAGLPTSIENLAYDDRQVIQQTAKRDIARCLAEQVPDHASLFITLGTTTEEVAKALLGHQRLRVITNNLNVATVLSANPDFEIIIAGGVVRSRDRGVTGEATIDFIRQFRVDIGVIGISGIDTDGSLLDFDYREVRVLQAIMAQSRQVWLAADKSKFGRNAMVRLGQIQDVHSVFTDQAPPSPWRDILDESQTRLIISGER